MTITTLRNVVIGIGAYTLGRLASVAVELLLRSAIDLVLHPQGAGASLVRALDASLPDAIGAAASGIAVAWLVDSPRPAGWILIPAAAWLLLLAGGALVQTPTWLDAATQLFTAAFPAFTCIAAGRMALWHRDRT